MSIGRDGARAALKTGYHLLHHNKYHVESVPLSDIVVDKQPRFKFDKIDELSQTIDEIDLEQPITVMCFKDDPNKVLLVSGERRLRAFKQLGKARIPARVIEYCEPDELLYRQLIENIQREDLTPFEISSSCDQLIQSGKTIDELSKKLGKSARTIRAYLQINRIPESAKKLISDENLSFRIIRKLFTEDVINNPSTNYAAIINDQKNQTSINKKQKEKNANEVNESAKPLRNPFNYSQRKINQYRHYAEKASSEEKQKAIQNLKTIIEILET